MKNSKFNTNKVTSWKRFAVFAIALTLIASLIAFFISGVTPATTPEDSKGYISFIDEHGNNVARAISQDKPLYLKLHDVSLEDIDLVGDADCISITEIDKDTVKLELTTDCTGYFSISVNGIYETIDII